VASVRPEVLHGRWVHAHEEDAPGEMVFRPAGYDLPPARGRMSFELKSDGTFREFGLGAADVPDEASGTWDLEDGQRIVLGPGARGGVPRVLPVKAVDDTRLVIAR
jgi:hypothetical protein